jgi:hypothetical protein
MLQQQRNKTIGGRVDQDVRFEISCGKSRIGLNSIKRVFFFN